MALIFCDDGEVGLNVYAWTETTMGAHSTSAKDGTYAIGVGGVGAFYAKKVFSGTYTELFVSLFCLITSVGDSRMFTWYTGTTELGSVRWNSTSKKFEIYTGTATLQATGTALQQAVPQGGTWFNLNIRILLHASTGVIDVRFEGNTASDCIFNGNTLPSGSNLNGILIGNIVGNTPQVYDNLFVCDTSGSQNNSWPGVIRASTQFPTGKSATNDAWTADSGTNKYDRVNEQPANESSHVFSESTGQKQGFTYAAPAFSGIIKAVVINDLAHKISLGGIKQGVRISGTDYASGAKLLKTAVTRESLHQHILELNPNTTVAFLDSENFETYLEKTA